MSQNVEKTVEGRVTADDDLAMEEDGEDVETTVGHINIVDPAYPDMFPAINPVI
jgi:hypothetical protein